MQLDPIRPTLKPPGSKRLKLKCDIQLSTFALKFKLRRYTKDYLDDFSLHPEGRGLHTFTL